MISTMKMHWSVDYFMAAQILQPVFTEMKIAQAAEVTNVVRRFRYGSRRYWKSEVVEILHLRVTIEFFYSKSLTLT